MLKLSDIQMRDPYILLENGTYYLFGTTDVNCWKGPFEGFNYYASADLENWRGPFPAFRPEKGFFGTKNFWAPEVHKYKNGFYMFASFKADDIRRGTAVLKSAGGPEGPYHLHSKGNITPSEWECLDGTLFVDDVGRPWMIFCHEWVQEGGGTICAMPLRQDISAAEGDAATLFCASEVKWADEKRHSSGVTGFVTDGPFLYRADSGALIMLWSSVTQTGYGIGQSVSENGSILGPWKHQDDALFRADGGHGMVFRDKNGALLLTIHTPNNTPAERPVFIPLMETASGLSLKDQKSG